MVKVVILRFIRGQLDATSLRAALKKKGINLSKKKATRKADKIVEALAAYLAKTDGPEMKSSFEGAVQAVAQALAQGAEATAEELEELIDYFHEKLRAERLTEAEHTALRLYTGPAYVKMNSSLRLASEKMPDWMTAHLKGNRYTNIIYLCQSAMLKISRAGRIPRGRRVYRGQSGFSLPKVFVVAGEDGGRGGAEFAFLSTSTNKDVAVSYIDTEKGLPILFEFEVGSIDRGAPISFLSQFPGEDEILIPPMSFLEVTGEPFTMDVGTAQVTVYPARINCNLKGQTMEQIEARRCTDLLAQEPYLMQEFRRDVPRALQVLINQHFTLDVYCMQQEGDDRSAERRYVKEWEELKKHDADWFNDDAHYVEAIAKVYNSKHTLLAEAVKATFKEDPNMSRPALFAAVEAEAVDVVKQLLSVEGAAIDVKDEEGTTAAQFAAERGCAKALAALADAGADLCAARHDGAAALGRAVVSSPACKDAAGAICLILKRTSPRLLESFGVKDGMDFNALVALLARAFISPAALAERLSQVTPAGLKGEIGALLRSTDLPDAAKGKLSKVRAFVDLHASLLDSAHHPGLPHLDTRVWQLASQEPNDVFGAHADMVAAAMKESPNTQLIEWLNKPQTRHPCLNTLMGKEAVLSVAHSSCGTRIVRAEGKVVIVSDAETGFELHRFVGHTSAVHSVAWNPANPDELASGSGDNSIRIYSMKTRMCTRTMTGHRCDCCLVFSQSAFSF